mgnify:CR=1 FL=1
MGEQLRVRGAREHNLRDIDVAIPRDSLVVVTGLSGSGKSSLAFDTVYAEGQRRYVESLSAYARQFLGQMDKPDVDFIEGLAPAISIDQKSASRNPRSTVGTITEVYDYLRLLYARIGVQHDPETGEVVERQTPQQIVDRILQLEEGTRFQVLAPVVRGRKGEYSTLFADLLAQGFARARIDGEVRDLDDSERLERYVQHTIEVVVDRLVMRDGIEQRLTESVETALNLAAGHVYAHIVPKGDGAEQILQYRRHLYSPGDGRGTRYVGDPARVGPDPDRPLGEGASAPWAGPNSRYLQRLLAAVGAEFDIPMDVAWGNLTAAQRKKILYGTGKKKVTVRYKNRYGRQRTYSAAYEGVVPSLERRHTDTDSDWARDKIEGYMREVACHACGGARLNEVSRAVTVGGRSLHELCDLSIGESAKAVAELDLSERDLIVAEPIVKEVTERLNFLLDVGLDYLTLNRSAGTLAGGEAQRIRLASQIGSGLVGVLYVLDEPSIGLHQRDNARLIDTLVRLRDLGNTVLVVEHDEDTIRVSDHVIDIGPGAGEHGGELVHSGSVAKLLKNKKSITGQYLAGKRTIPVPEQRRPLTEER